MNRGPLWAVAVSLAIAACSDKKAPDNIGTQTANIASDTRVLKDAQAAVNEVVRSAPDCEAVKAALPAARQAIDEAAKRVQTTVGQQSLDVMRTQLRAVVGACP